MVLSNDERGWVMASVSGAGEVFEIFSRHHTSANVDGSMHYWGFHNLRRYNRQKISKQTQLQDTG